MNSQAVDQAASSTEAQPKRRRKWLKALVVAVLIGVPCVMLTMAHVERQGAAFFDTGKVIVNRLGYMADTLEHQDLAVLESCYADSYVGERLGLNDRELAGERDGLRTELFRPPAGATDKAGALAEWSTYLEGFQSVEEANLHIHRLHEWQGGRAECTVRYELIGTPKGAIRSVIDRAYFRMSLSLEGKAPLVTGATLTREPPEPDHAFGGERTQNEKAHFVDVGDAAGIDFENRYYPAFLDENRDEPLKFNMLRYGPAGMCATDYDNDGLYDLFIPDGVESRLFHNEGDGTFQDVTEEAGLSGQDGVSVALFADFDNDGHKDCFISRTFSPNRIFHNRGDGTFEDVSERAGLSEDCATTVASCADYDNDGLLDLYVGRYLDPRLRIPTTFYARNGEPNQLYKNNGDMTFTNVTDQTGVDELGLCLGSVFGDYDNDGDADLYVVNDFGRKTLYRNEGKDAGYRFTDVTVEAGTLAYGAGMSASFGDYDNDGLLDIYVAHIRSEHGWFATGPTIRRYMANTWRQGVWKTDMPLYWEIFRQSGVQFVSVFQDMASGNTLLRNAGDGTFEDTTWAAEANPPGWFWGSGFADFDNDGWQDIYAVNGWVYNEVDTEIELDFFDNVMTKMQTYKTGQFFDPNHFGGHSWHGWERNRYLLSQGRDADGQVSFKEVGHAAGNDLLMNSRGMAVADFWNRGVLDIAVAASTDRHALLRNDVGASRNWLAVELEGAAGTLADGTNRDAAGARVTIEVGGEQQLREVFLGDGYASQNSLRQYFGIGDRESVDELVVRWPRSGREQRFQDVSANRIVRVVESQDELQQPERRSVTPPSRSSR